MNKEELETNLCKQLCTDIQLIERKNGMWMISVPFSYPDGDRYSIYLKNINSGKVRISDEANTIMRLSYDTPDVSKFFKGNRGKLMEQILRETKVQEDDGNFYVETTIDKISEATFRLTQALNQIYDLSYLNRDRPAVTFYKDLEELLNKIATEHTLKLNKDYIVPGLENAENYSIDYFLQNNGNSTLFLFGVPTTDKAKLVTITLQYLLIHKNKNPTLIIFEDQEEIAPFHRSRLMDANIGGALVSSISSREAIEQNIGVVMH